MPAVGVEPDLAADHTAQRRRDFRALARLASLTCPCRAGAGHLTADALHLLRSLPRAALMVALPYAAFRYTVAGACRSGGAAPCGASR